MEDMPLRDPLLAEFDMEMATTRRVLERVPDAKLGYQPHAKSWDMGTLAGHIANVCSWTGVTMQQSHFDIGSPQAAPPAKPASSAALMEAFDKAVAGARDTLANAADEQFTQLWSLRKGEAVLFSMPKAAVLRNFILKHIVHHRGQLSVYLRLNDIPVPSIYGPSADENPFG